LFSTKPVGGNDSAAIGIYFASGNINLWNNGSLINGAKPTENQWHHLAITRNSSNLLTLWIDGTVFGTYSNFTANLSRDSISIGSLAGGGEILSGQAYISNLRMLKGTAVYTSAFTPPTSPVSAVSGTSLLCNFTNASIVDETGRNVIETVGNAQIDTGVKKYGTGSMQFDGTGDYLTIQTSPQLDFGTGDFTIEFWLYLNSIDSTSSVLSKGSYGPYLVYTTGSELTFYSSSNGSSWTVSDLRITSGNLTTSNWHHVAVTRSGNTFRTFFNGSLANSTTSSHSLVVNTTNLDIGRDRSSGNEINGYIDDFRITKGVARYTAGFTPPTQTFALR